MPRPPQGNNKLGAFAAFAERTAYRRYAYPANLPFIDLWEKGHQLYGKVDWHYNARLVREDTLKQLPGGKRNKKTLFALDYVADAFMDLKHYYEDAARAGIISSTSNILMNPQAAWSNIHDTFHEYNQSVYSIFMENYLSQEAVSRKITSFSLFLKHFLRFVATVPRGTSITRSAFVYSKLTPPSATGLFIELAKEKHDDDAVKYNKFLKDKNFHFYVKAAERFGFLVDKNAPWRLVANLRSPVMQGYMESYGIAPEDMFDNYYFYACDHDIDALKMYFRAYYENFILQHPTVSILSHKNGVTCTRVVKRAPIAASEMNSMADLMWLRAYTYLRVYESDANWTQQYFETQMANINEYYKKNTLQNTQRYVSLDFKGCHLPPPGAKKDLTPGTLGGKVEFPVRRSSNPLQF